MLLHQSQPTLQAVQCCTSNFAVFWGVSLLPLHQPCAFRGSFSSPLLLPPAVPWLLQLRYKADGFLFFLGGCRRNYTCLSRQSCVALKASGLDENYISCNVQHLVHSCCTEWNTKLTAVWSSWSSPQSSIAEFLNMPLKLYSSEKSVKLDLCLCLPFPCAPFLLLRI